MSDSPTCISVGQSQLRLVPSVHFHLAFAEEVNRLAFEHRPDAIAVELGPQSAATASAWLRELNVSANSRLRASLPCMLGLVKQTPPNETGDPKSSVLFLSPTDSIVEAIRCSIELDVPLFGVDLEDTETAVRKDHLLQYPDSSPGRSFSMDQYVRRNSGFAEHQRDESVDHARDVAMAGRLKGILEKYQRVLFVCGLAHLRNLDAMLKATEPTAVTVSTTSNPTGHVFQRVVVHPLVAIHYLDTLPALAEKYQLNRPHAAASRTLTSRVDRRTEFAEKLNNAYLRHFAKQPKGSAPGDETLNDFEARMDFQQLLENLCVLRQRTVPDLFSILQSGQGVMSDRFCRTLAEVLLEFPWAEPKDHQDVPILAPAPTEIGHESRMELVERDGQRSEGFYLQAIPGRSGINRRIRVPWKWEPEPPAGNKSKGGYTGSKSSWVPTGDLMAALRLRAMQLARDHSERPKVEVFEGNLYDGVDLKATMRAVIRGDDRVYVRMHPRRQQPRHTSQSDEDSFPFIWIFQPDVRQEQVHWMCSADSLTSLRPHCTDPSMLDRVRSEFGRYLISVVLATSSTDLDKSLSVPGCRVNRHEVFAQLNFNPAPGVIRTATWSEEMDYKTTPIADGTGHQTLSALYQQRHGIDLSGFSWAESLVMMAIPYANKVVTVVAPDAFLLSRAVHQKARSEDVELRVIPLSFFPASAIRKISSNHFIPTLGRTQDGKDLPIYPEHVLRQFDEDVEVYRHLVPKSWR